MRSAKTPCPHVQYLQYNIFYYCLCDKIDDLPNRSHNTRI